MLKHNFDTRRNESLTRTPKKTYIIHYSLRFLNNLWGLKMAFKDTALRTAYAMPLIFAAATASAQGKLPVIEPSATDLSKPLAAACVETTAGQPNLTAWDKLKTIMGARGQMIAASGDKIVQGNQRREKIFTVSNNFSGKEGYVIDSSSSKADREGSNSFCFIQATHAVVVDNSKLDAVPAVVNKGELGVALGNNHKLGSKVAVMGLAKGSLFAVHFNPANNKGAYKEANGIGGQAADLAILENFDYSPKMKVVMEQLSAAKPDSQVAVLALPKAEPR